MKQLSLHQTNWKHRYAHGGVLRNSRAGRCMRPLSSRDPIHLVFKANRKSIRGGFRIHKRFALIHQLLDKYKKKFFIRIEQISIQGDHLHLLIRSSKRSNYQSFFRVLAGQISQRFAMEGLLEFRSNSIPLDVTDTPTATRNLKTKTRKPKRLWLHRPFTRVIKGWKSYQIVRNYIQLNEQEACGRIPYRKSRLRGLSSSEWDLLWN